MATEKKLEYVVTKEGVTTAPGGDEHKIGDIVKLTDGQAKSRVNKVQLKSEVSATGKPGEEIKRLKTELSEVSGKLEASEKACGELSASADEAVKDKDELVLMTIERDDLQEKLDVVPTSVEQLTEALKAAKIAAK